MRKQLHTWMHLGTLPIFVCALQSYRNNSRENSLFRNVFFKKGCHYQAQHYRVISSLSVAWILGLSAWRGGVYLLQHVCVVCPDLHALFVGSVLLFMRILSEGPFTKRTCVWGLFLKLLYSCSFLASVLFHLPLLCPQEEEETDTKLVLWMIIYLLSVFF